MPFQTKFENRIEVRILENKVQMPDLQAQKKLHISVKPVKVVPPGLEPGTT